MRTLSIIFCAVLLCSFQPEQGKIAAESHMPVLKAMNSKTDIFEYLDQTKETLENSVKDLSEEQMTFKPGPDRWSVAECMEHIVIVENAMNSMLQEKLMGPEDEDVEMQISMEDDEVLGMINDRSSKIKTTPNFEPTGKFKSADEALEAFDDQREDIVDALKDSDTNLRNYLFEMPFGKMDGYQVVLFMAGHTARHTQQIEEVKNSPGFPED